MNWDQKSQVTESSWAPVMSRTSEGYCHPDNRDLHPTYHKIHCRFDRIYVFCIDKGKQRIQRKGRFPQLAIEVFLQKNTRETRGSIE